MQDVQAPLEEHAVQAGDIPASQHRLWQSLLVHCTLLLQVTPSAFFGEQFSLAT